MSSGATHLRRPRRSRLDAPPVKSGNEEAVEVGVGVGRNVHSHRRHDRRRPASMLGMVPVERKAVAGGRELAFGLRHPQPCQRGWQVLGTAEVGVLLQREGTASARVKGFWARQPRRRLVSDQKGKGERQAGFARPPSDAKRRRAVSLIRPSENQAQGYRMGSSSAPGDFFSAVPGRISLWTFAHSSRLSCAARE